MSRPILEIEGLHKRYGDTVALAGVDLTVESGEIVGLLGPNGAGKTTLVSIVCGLRRPDLGRVGVGGIDVRAHPQRARRLIGMAPQETGIYPMVSVYHNLRLFAELAGGTKRTVDGHIEQVATALGLGQLMERKAGELSGGQKRRLHTAIALLGEPPLILLDEATTGADVETRARLIEMVRSLSRRGSAVVYSTHYLHEVEALGASVVILERGEVVASGSVGDLVAAHGGAVVELAFEGDPPAGLDGYRVDVHGPVVRFEADDPARAVAELLAGLGSHARRVKGIEIIRPSLETVYLTLTGRRYSEAESDVVAA